MGAGYHGGFGHTKGAERHTTENDKKTSKPFQAYNLSNSKSVKRVDNVIVSNNLHNIPEYSSPNSVHISNRNGTLRSERYFDENGNPYLDIDYTNHGNAKMHLVVPHEHSIKVENGKIIRDKKWRKIQK